MAGPRPYSEALRPRPRSEAGLATRQLFLAVPVPDSRHYLRILFWPVLELA